MRATAAGLYLWNPYVAERLVLGSWVLLLGYASLPWVLDAARRIRRAEPGGWPRLVLPMALAALAPTGGLLAAAVAVAVVGPGARRRLAAAATAAVLNAPWWVPALLQADAAGSDDAGVAAFAARAESWAGALGSLLGLGGVWNAAVVPASRGTVVAPLLTAVVLGLAAAGLRPLARSWGGGVFRPVAALAAAGLLLAVAGSWPPTADLLAAAVRTVPGAGLLRDGQKWVALLALPLAPAAALGAARYAERLAAPAARRAAAVAALALPLAVLPDLAWGAFGRLEPVDYPPDWAAVRTLLQREPRGGDVVALPYAAFRAFEWNGGRTALDPAPRWLPRTVVTDDRLAVGPALVSGEDPRAGAVGAALRPGAVPETDRLLREGIGWVLVEHRTPGPQLPLLDGLERAYAGPDLSLYRLPGEPAPPPEAVPAGPVLLADAAALALLGVAVGGLAITARRRCRGTLPTGRVPVSPDEGATECRSC